MDEVRFHLTIGEDRLLEVPEGVTLKPGPAEVIVLQESLPEARLTEAPRRHLFERLANLANELGIDTSELPTDLAMNHDHYLHGLPKGIDNE